MLFRDSLKHEPVTFSGGRSPTDGSDKTAAGAEAPGAGGRGAAAEDTGVRANERKQGSSNSVRENRLTKAVFTPDL